MEEKVATTNKQKNVGVLKENQAPVIGQQKKIATNQDMEKDQVLQRIFLPTDYVKPVRMVVLVNLVQNVRP
tara:strand:- start:821 stop:1033 length:213 start_codon:yes stop_codon:yes gene_type:complete